MTKLILSVVVPTYNIEQYLERCVVSFTKVEDKYAPLFELLIVNDGSTDNSANIANELITKYSMFNIRLIDKANAGHGSTINRGIQEAKGKYFKVVDGDDWVDTSAFEQYLDKLMQLDVDLVLTDFTEQYVLEDRQVHVPALSHQEEIALTKLPDHKIAMHSITYKTELLKNNHIQLTEKIFYVDIQYAVFPTIYIHSIYYLPLNVYQYFIGRVDQSMSWQSRIRNVRHHQIMTTSILDFYDKHVPHHPELKEMLDYLLADLVNSQYLVTALSDEKDIILKEFTETLKQSTYNYSFDRNKKTSYLLYFNESTKHLFNFVLNPIINKKINQIKTQYKL